MRGTYTVYLDKENIGSFTNVVTDSGKTLLLRYIAGLVPSFAQAVAVGVGTTAANASQTDLDFEYSRSQILVGTIDTTGVVPIVTFKAEFPTGDTVQINELAVFSYFNNPASFGFNGVLLSDFSSAADWQTTSQGLTTSHVNTTAISGTKIGKDSLKVTRTNVAGQTDIFTLNGLLLDASGYSHNDTIGLAILRADNNASSISIILVDDAGESASYKYTLGTYSAGAPYEILKATIGDFSYGGFNWSTISSMSIAIEHKNNAGTSNITLDGLRIFDADSIDNDYCMISRSVLNTPVLKDSDKTLDIEYSVEFDL